MLSVLGKIAEDNGSRLAVVRDDDRGPSSTLLDDLGLRGDHQRGNAALALAMCRYAAECRPDLTSRRRPPSSSTSTSDAADAVAREGDVRRALSTSFWPGRCHTVHLADPKREDGDGDDGGDGIPRWRPSITLRCDGAHTPISMNSCVRWFREVTTATATANDGAPSGDGGGTRTDVVVKRALVFNCGHERNPIPLLFCLCRSGMFDSVHFCRADSERPSALPKDLEDGWTMEPLPLAAPIDASGESTTTTTTTWESMRDSLSTTTNVDCVQNGSPDDVAAGSSSSAATWQDQLGCLWRVMDAYLRRYVRGYTSACSSSSVTTGLSVRDALASIRNEAVSWAATIDDDNTVDADRRELSIEVCVTGSLYIVGSALSAAGWEEGDKLVEL